MLGELLPRQQSWSDSIEMWGDENGDRVHAMLEGWRIVELVVRLDLRNPNRKLAEKLLRLARELEFDLESSNNHRFSPSLAGLLATIRNSDSYRFIVEPKKFFEEALSEWPPESERDRSRNAASPMEPE